MPILESKVVKTQKVVAEEIVEALAKGEFEVIENRIVGSGWIDSGRGDGTVSHYKGTEVVEVETATHYIMIQER